MPIKERIGIYVWQSKVKHTLQMIPDHRDTFRSSRHFADHLDTFQIIWTLLRSSRHVSDPPYPLQIIPIPRSCGHFADHPQIFHIM